MAKLTRFLWITLGSLCFLFFQNFENIPLDRLKPNFKPSAKAFENELDIREIAPSPESSPSGLQLASPTSGTDLESISVNWAQKQTQILTGGAEQRLIDQLNKNLLFNDRRPASTDSEIDPEDDKTSPAKSFLKLKAINRLEIHLANQTKIDCSVDGEKLNLDLHSPSQKNINFSLSHESSSSKSSVLLHYDW